VAPCGLLALLHVSTLLLSALLKSITVQGVLLNTHTHTQYGMESIACAPGAPETKGKRTKLRPDPGVDSAYLLDLETHFMHVAMRLENHDKPRRPETHYKPRGSSDMKGARKHTAAASKVWGGCPACRQACQQPMCVKRGCRLCSV
jgi:hypothetical protein